MCIRDRGICILTGRLGRPERDVVQSAVRPCRQAHRGKMCIRDRRCTTPGLHTHTTASKPRFFSSAICQACPLWKGDVYKRQFLHKGPGASFILLRHCKKRKPPPAYYAGSGVYYTSKYVGHSHFFRTMTTTATAVHRAAMPMIAKKP